MTLVAGVDSSTQSCKVVVVDAATGAEVTAAQSELAGRIFGLRNLSGSVVTPDTVYVVVLKVDRGDSRTYLTRFIRAELC